MFILGVGGSAANASHAVNDFRKIVGVEAYAPTDNVAELTARTNDDGWDSVFAAWLQTSRLKAGDMVCVFSVGEAISRKTSALISLRRCNMRSESVHGLWVSSDAMGGTRPKWLMRALSCQPSIPVMSRPIPRHSRRSYGICSLRTQI